MLDFAEPSSLLPGLRPAAWRGFALWAIDVEHGVGRRIHATLYPGLDLKTHDDTGPLDGHIQFDGLIIGDDYVAKAKALMALCRQPGSGTYIDPWLGPKDCVLIRPARISFASDELRVARVQLVFDPTGEDLLGGLAGGLLGGVFASLSGLLGAVGGIIGAAVGLVSSALSFVPMALAVFSFGVSAIGTVLSIASTVVGTVRQAATLVALARDIGSEFNRAVAIGNRKEAATVLASLVTSYPAKLGASFRPQPPAALGPSAEAPPAPAQPPDPRAGAGLMFQIAATIARRASGAIAAELPGRSPATETERLVYLAAEAAFVAEGISLMAEIEFESRQDAQTWQSKAEVALAGASTRAAELAGAAPAVVAELWQALEAARGRLAIDMSEVIGRLPAVITINPPRASAWLLAQHYAGDNPADVVPMLHDIVRRNRLRHPAVLCAGPLELLKPKGQA
ncbi:DNA circularization N-terminal domain-containing protein [Bosea sp. (in: a-proteobacteria)]|uniref:DNA circularization N-terminal domain-containing protein n=1 Tax=Bosea sp. (in: a-proteobacteria) TaxID=1871050 RepID=UPI001AC1A910|nr:DNA circularization N-terminal domain-containing protein [Bosea sp. (in: a-proteobacteria)]MBN9438989.1 DNA circularization N-terminal domain-containing protein [Bosea sp. (in: a-proteobacteria)]